MDPRISLPSSILSQWIQTSIDHSRKLWNRTPTPNYLTPYLIKTVVISLACGTSWGQGRPPDSRPSVNKHRSCGNGDSGPWSILKSPVPRLCLRCQLRTDAHLCLESTEENVIGKCSWENVHETASLLTHLAASVSVNDVRNVREKTQMFFSLPRCIYDFHIIILCRFLLYFIIPIFSTMIFINEWYLRF